MHPCHPCLRPYKYEQGIHVIMMSLISLTAGILIKYMERRCRTGLDAAIAPLTSTVPAETDAMPIPVYDGTDATAISSATESTEPLSTASEYRNQDCDNSTCIPVYEIEIAYESKQSKNSNHLYTFGWDRCYQTNDACCILFNLKHYDSCICN